MSKFAAIDFGLARTGVAVSDELGMFGHPHSVLATPKDLNGLAKLILETLSSISLKGLVLGLPLHLNGTEGKSAAMVRELASHIETLAPDLTIHLWDERLTTTQVERSMKEANLNRRKRSKHIDKGAAALILQSFLDANRIL